MKREEVLQGLETLLRQHSDGLRGSVHQEPYRQDFFRLFAGAYNEGLLNRTMTPDPLLADRIADILTSRAPELVQSETWASVYTFWHEWTYAWNNVALKR